MNINTSTTSTSSTLNYNSSPNINVGSKIKNSTSITGLINNDCSEISNKIVDSMNNDSCINSYTDELKDTSFIKGPWTAEV